MATVTPEVQHKQRVNAAIVEFQKRLAKKGVVLTNDEANVVQISNYLRKNNLDITNADAFEMAYRVLAPKGLLSFEKGKEPASLKSKPEGAPAPSAAAIQKGHDKAAQERERLARDQEAAEVFKKAEEKAKAELEAVISRYHPISQRTNTVAYGKQAVWQEKTRETIKNCQAKNVSYLPEGSGWKEVKPFTWQTTLKMVAKIRDDQYRADENASSKM